MEVGNMSLPFRTLYSASRGLYLQLNVRRQNVRTGRVHVNEVELPDICIDVVRKQNTITCTTRSLIKLNGNIKFYLFFKYFLHFSDRLNQSVNEIFLLSSS